MRAISLTFKIQHLFRDVLEVLKIDFVVAPYEADAQIAYMVREGLADFAISEDGDLIGYGCPKLLMKLNPQSGKGTLYDSEAVMNYEVPDDKKGKPSNPQLKTFKSLDIT